jgi:hypothetical protein
MELLALRHARRKSATFTERHESEESQKQFHASNGIRIHDPSALASKGLLALYYTATRNTNLK